MGTLLIALVIAGVSNTGIKPEAKAVQVKYQGKTVKWWANRAVQNRRKINRLKRTLRYNPTIEESIKLATITYPSFTEHRAWCIIDHESQGRPNARNRDYIGWPGNNASGLYQFLPSTFRSTPYGGFSIYSIYAQSLAAGWMHQNGRSGEWAINC